MRPPLAIPLLASLVRGRKRVKGAETCHCHDLRASGKVSASVAHAQQSAAFVVRLTSAHSVTGHIEARRVEGGGGLVSGVAGRFLLSQSIAGRVGSWTCTDPTITTPKRQAAMQNVGMEAAK